MEFKTKPRRFKRETKEGYTVEDLLSVTLPTRQLFQCITLLGWLFQQYLWEMFVKVECERLSFWRENQTKLRSCDYTHLRELFVDTSYAMNEMQAWTEKKEVKKLVIQENFVVLPSTHIRIESFMRQKSHDIIVISNCIGYPDVFLTMACNPR